MRTYGCLSGQHAQHGMCPVESSEVIIGPSTAVATTLLLLHPCNDQLSI